MASDLVEQWRGRIDERLSTLIHDHDDACPRLVDAMRYCLLAPGKRVRPLLAILTALDLDRDPEPLLDFGSALEMVHCASLMLDDLPCMDDASTRRGQPAAHLQFGDATTTLAAVALLNQAFGVLARSTALDQACRTELIARLSGAVGTAGLVSGQSRDLVDRDDDLDGDSLRRIHHQKTGVLFELAVAGAATTLDVDRETVEQLNHYAHHVGIAFQTADDLLDAVQFASNSGKDHGIDAGKAGSVHHVGEAELRARLIEELSRADAELRPLGLHQGLLQSFIRGLFRRLL